MIVIETLDELKDYVKKVTAEQRDALSKKEEEVEKVYSDTAKGLLSVWEKADFGCQRPHVAQILHLLLKGMTGEDIEFPKHKEKDERDAFIKKYSMVVLESNTNSHSYGEEPFLIKDTYEFGIRMPGGHIRRMAGDGNNPGFGENTWRFATDEEIDFFFETVDEESRKSLTRMIE